MTDYEKPHNEEERLAALRELKILDTPVEERFERITRMVCRTLGVPMAAISLVDEDRQWFKSFYGSDDHETPRDISFCTHTIMQEEPLVVNNALEDARFRQSPLVTGDPNVRFYAGVPLELSSDVRIGALCAIDTVPNELTPDQLDLLKDLAEMVRAELMSVKLSEAHRDLVAELEQAKRAALIDPLTRLWNRRGGEMLRDREWQAAKSKGTSLAVAMVDIDNFKQVNDTHGHDAGDQVIKGVARNIMARLRQHDVVVRWGGEEFLIIMPDCSAATSVAVLNRVRRDIVGCSYDDVKVTISAGAYIALPHTGEDAEQAVKAADTALYWAKNNGRDRVELHFEAA